MRNYINLRQKKKIREGRFKHLSEFVIEYKGNKIIRFSLSYKYFIDAGLDYIYVSSMLAEDIPPSFYDNCIIGYCLEDLYRIKVCKII